jgi:hypothetical protein
VKLARYAFFGNRYSCIRISNNVNQREYDEQRKGDASKSAGNVKEDVIPALESPIGYDLPSVGWDEEETPTCCPFPEQPVEQI